MSGATYDVTKTLEVFNLLLERREKQVEMYGLNENLADGTGPNVRWLESPDPFLASRGAKAIERALRQDYEANSSRNGGPGTTWMHLVREEVAEAFTESEPEALINELVDVAALCVSWIERLIDRSQEEM